MKEHCDECRLSLTEFDEPIYCGTALACGRVGMYARSSPGAFSVRTLIEFEDEPTHPTAERPMRCPYCGGGLTLVGS